ncbi:hypothetical protein [Williamsia sp.]|uniref:WXG100 family type VII secretion target n=1 Tax=Williamsia sp. TaxID=1872085 RepID=UPI001A31F275|nr:hypothetical protein [Williamsia sp.]MBJ7291136.1 hypothetical protein [Williamsia sp.]
MSGANFSAMRTSAGSLDTQATSIDQNADTLTSTFSDAPWTGAAKNAAQHKAEQERREHRKVSADLRALGTDLRSDADTMDNLCKLLVRDATALESDNFAVSDDWAVRDLHNYERAYLEADKDDDAVAHAQVERLQKQRAQEAANETRRLRGHATELTQVDQKTASSINSHLQTIGQLAPASADLSAARATQDMATLSGKNSDGSSPSDEQKKDAAERLHAAADLDQSTRDSLDQTGKGGISQEKFDYLKGVAAQLPDKVSNYDDVGGDLKPDQYKAVQGDVADTLRILGNPGLSTSNGDRGGMTQLPDNVQTLLTRSPTGSGTTTIPNKEGKSDAVVPTVELKRFDDWRALTNNLGSGDQDLRHGSDVDRGLLKQASEVAGKLTPGSDAQMFSTDSKISNEDVEVRRTLDAMLNNASGDHQAVHDFVTGSDSMKATISGDGAYNANDHLNGLLQHQWSSDEHGARNVFDWLKDPASVSAPGHEGQLAGETATGLAHHLSSNASDLNHMRDSTGGGLSDDYTTLGKVNPELVRSLAGDLSPYLGGLGGIPADATVAHGVTPFGSKGEMSAMFGVLDGDPQSAATINHNASNWIEYAAQEAGRDPSMSAGLGHFSGTLNDVMHDGLNEQISALKANDDYGQATRSNELGTVYDTGAAALGMIPGAGPAVGLLAPGAKLDLLGETPIPGADQADSYTAALQKLATDGRGDSLARQFSFAEGYIQDHPQQREVFENFFGEKKELDWDKVTSGSSDFKQIIDNINAYKSYAQEFDDGSGDAKVDPKKIPRP